MKQRKFDLKESMSKLSLRGVEEQPSRENALSSANPETDPAKPRASLQSPVANKRHEIPWALEFTPVPGHMIVDRATFEEMTRKNPKGRKTENPRMKKAPGRRANRRKVRKARMPTRNRTVKAANSPRRARPPKARTNHRMDPRIVSRKPPVKKRTLATRSTRRVEYP